MRTGSPSEAVSATSAVFVPRQTIFSEGLLVLSAKFLEGGRKKNLKRETFISLIVKSSNYGLLNGLK